jgi:hypothetical protein
MIRKLLFTGLLVFALPALPAIIQRTITIDAGLSGGGTSDWKTPTDITTNTGQFSSDAEGDKQTGSAADLDYEIKSYETANLARLRILVNSVEVDALYDELMRDRLMIDLDRQKVLEEHNECIADCKEFPEDERQDCEDACAAAKQACSDTCETLNEECRAGCKQGGKPSPSEPSP